MVILLACLGMLLVFVCGGLGIVFWSMAWSLGWEDGFPAAIIGSILIVSALNLLRD